MLAIKGIFDGKSIHLLDKIAHQKKYKVIVTFIEEIHSTDTDLRNFSSQSVGLDFWNDSREDLYQDFIKPKKKKK